MQARCGSAEGPDLLQQVFSALGVPPAAGRLIVAATEEMNRMTQQVSHATAEQKEGGELVLKAMSRILEIGHENLETVEETSQAASNLSRQADSLARLIGAFKAR